MSERITEPGRGQEACCGVLKDRASYRVWGCGAVGVGGGGAARNCSKKSKRALQGMKRAEFSSLETATNLIRISEGEASKS